MSDPVNRDDVVSYVAGLDDQQWKEVVTEARALDAAIKAAEKAGRWRESMGLKTLKLAQLISNADENGHPRK